MGRRVRPVERVTRAAGSPGVVHECVGDEPESTRVRVGACATPGIASAARIRLLRGVWIVLMRGVWVLSAAGCAASWYARDADREVGALLTRFDARVLGDRADWVREPARRTEDSTGEGAVGAGAASSPEPRAPSDRAPRLSDDASTPDPGGAGSPGEGASLSTAEPTVSADGPPPSDAPPASSASDVLPDGAAPGPLVIDLPTALSVAFAGSRDFQDRKEALYLRGLALTLARFDFGPVLDSTISYLWTNVEDGDANDSAQIALGARQVLGTGGTLSVASAINTQRTDDPRPFDFDDTLLFDSSVQVNLRQPLLRGAGYEPSHETLTQSERNLMYEVRSFELFRQDFCIRVANAYYGLVSQDTRLANDERNYLEAVFDREKAEALRKVDRNQDDDVFLAQRREIDAEDALLVSRTDYERALDDFKILLGLPASTRITIVNEEPAFEPVRVDPASAVAVAYANRLDLHTERDRLEDTVRQVRLARNALLPAWDMTLGYRRAGGLDGEASLRRAAPHDWTATVGVDLEIPVNRKSERNAYRASQIALDQARRDYERLLDEVRRDILDQVRELGQLEKRITLQTGKIERDNKAVAVTRIRYEAGDVDNRDLLDARQGLIDARNALIDLKVQHFIARLRLLRNMGVMFVDEHGMWKQ